MSVDISQLSPAAQKQVMAKMGRRQKKSKYGNIKTQIGGITFDSRKEAGRYAELMAMQRAGKIRDLHLQQDFTLQEAFTEPTGSRIRAIRYKCDFTYIEDGKLVVEDVKSRATKTAVYAMKKKMMQQKFGIEIKEV